jgi:glutamate carboxypeptidase
MRPPNLIPAENPCALRPVRQLDRPLKEFLNQQMPAALEMLRQMVGINSYTRNPEGVNQLAGFTAQCFEPLGFTAEFVPSANPEFGNHLVLTRKGHSAKSIAMVSHLDTVFPPEEEKRNNFHWQVEGDRLFGPGTQDIKGGTVMMWLVLSGLRAQAPKVFEDITWKLLWNSSEEDYSPDFGRLCRARFDGGTLAALVFEAEGRLGEEHLIGVARKGRGTWRVSVAGRGSHAGSKHSHGANAAVQLGKTIQRVAALTDYARDLTFNVATIRGGTVLNRVPHEAAAEGEFRAFTPEAYAHGKTSLLALAGPGEVRSRSGRGAKRGRRLRVRGEGADPHRKQPLAAQSGHRSALWVLEKGRGSTRHPGGLPGARRIERWKPDLGRGADAGWPGSVG